MSFLKYAIAAVLLWFIGALFAVGSEGFVSRSEPADLVVLKVEARRDTDGYTTYRPVFALAGDEPTGQGYAGNTWMRPAPHEAGDIVPGRYDADTGEMRSDRMLKKSSVLGKVARFLALLVGLQAVALLFGFPEELLPIRVRMGRRPWYQRMLSRNLYRG